MCFSANAQHSNGDGFFNNWENDYRNNYENDFSLTFPSSHGMENDSAAPLGSGLLILTALGGCYLVARKKR